MTYDELEKIRKALCRRLKYDIAPTDFALLLGFSKSRDRASAQVRYCELANGSRNVSPRTELQAIRLLKMKHEQLIQLLNKK